jgi:hypothetical protein
MTCTKAPREEGRPEKIIKTRGGSVKRWQKLILCLFAVVVAGYLGRDAIVRTVDQFAYEPALAVCASVLGLMEPDRLEIELRSYCNVHMIAIADSAGISGQ